MELVFHYTFGTVTVRGRALEPLWNALCRGTLARVIGQAGELPEQGEKGATSIGIIVVEDVESMSHGPVFPEKSGQNL
jgi:hypothetical protein